MRPGEVLYIDHDACQVRRLGLRAALLWRDRDNTELLIPNQPRWPLYESGVKYAVRFWIARPNPVAAAMTTAAPADKPMIGSTPVFTGGHSTS